MTLNRAVLTTGGTGGHIFPALAVADELRQRNPECAILFLGGSGPERELAEKHGLEFCELPARGIMGKGIGGKLQGVMQVLRGIVRARTELKTFRPEVVVGFGGYAGFSPVLAAAFSHIPCAVHEQNSVPGVTNRLLGKVADRVFLSFDDTTGAFPASKTMRTGNPVRSDIFSAHNAGTRGRNLLVLGGSQGARPINEAVAAILPELMSAGINLLHQAGKKEEQAVRAAYEQAGADPNCVHGFMDDMARAYAWADLALCRSGASTVFEIAAAGVPAVFVPFPQATHDHQTKNAMAMERTGAARLLEQDSMKDSLARTVLELLDAPETLETMAAKAVEFSAPTAAADIADELERLAGKGSEEPHKEGLQS
ncbi:undecaprenyldiphospho-muramoylpentapeptide beta-N-acetylglucosaminyltransferase [Pseudodesulfovibrio senegalensis]|uniref:UDP-N-acetylglucosamine--N-acetylmuramyl-(pentapeptide) pyrophosphoryl-undecaprenol N-acetylglucosamine transferase n=1 Tax=Pseudodesulfovibrio senegalensis TaxID=1721087 RepID=A0A6N6N2R9_9BACT|nr:undecaprenyldiphospho-muramoylpentapeptide beta-N-acetylglucosaminyltransferase [Pseudodesulfovibrio senegalensis]KAB1442135.1 undecaprenyldiphospho-muramoylpentapeptide beta-N-acetylglucosaminyltransferase [Pseudodesulfovibrio senegalensis]